VRPIGSIRPRLRRDADTWRVAFEQERAQRALPAPGNDAQSPETTPATLAVQPSRLRRTWRWLRSTGWNEEQEERLMRAVARGANDGLRVGGDRLEAPRLALPFGPLAGVAEVQEPGGAGSEARSKGGVGAMILLGSQCF